MGRGELLSRASSDDPGRRRLLARVAHAGGSRLRVDEKLPLSGCGGCRDLEDAPCRGGEHRRGWAYRRLPERDDVLAGISCNLPDLLLAVELEREDRPDLTRRVYYYRGRMQNAPASITYPPFDPEKLADPRAGLGPLH